jgi:predicted Zn-dependent peptidase
MKNLFLFTLLSLVTLFACTPKGGENISKTNTAKAKASAPVIPIPTGDVRAAAPQPGTAPKLQIGEAETFTLSNGLQVIVVENHKLPRVSYQIFIDNDPVLEKDAAGYIDMVGELLSKGTQSRDKATIDASVDFIGARLSSSSRGVNGSCLTKHSDKLLEVMSDVLLNPSFPQEELDKAKRRAESGLASARDDANAIAGNVNAVLSYGKNHPYGEVMTEETLEKINIDMIKNYYNTYFKPNISYLVVVGDITKEQAEAQAKKYFGSWMKGTVPSHKYDMPSMPQKTQVDFVNKAGAVQSVINVTYPVDLAPGSPDVIKARLMNTILGGYFNSRLNSNLREGKAYTYGARSSLNPDEIVGNFNAYASVRNEVTDSSITEFIREIDRLRTEKVPEEELQLVKNVLTGQFSQSLEQPGTVARFALSTARFKLPADYYEKYLENLQNVTSDDILAMAKKYLHPDRAHILVVGNREEVADKLAGFAADKKVRQYDIYGNPDKSSEVQIPDGVTATTIITDYLNAIGGNSKISAIKDLQFTASMKGMGPEILIQTSQKANKMLRVDVTMNGQVLSQQIFDGKKGSESGMGGSRAIEGDELLDMKEQAKICKEADFLSRGYKLTLVGVEKVNNKNAYALEIERMADGKKSMQYYDMETSLKLREQDTQEDQEGNPVTITNDILEYKEVDGVMLPSVISIGGVFPMPMKASITEIKANSGLEDSLFEVK